MMRAYCFEIEEYWDEAIHLLLFATRESVQESLGFSPFELVFGDTVRGPLKVLKGKLLSSSSESINLLKHVSDFRTKLLRACQIARDNLINKGSKFLKKLWYCVCVTAKYFLVFAFPFQPFLVSFALLSLAFVVFLSRKSIILCVG